MKNRRLVYIIKTFVLICLLFLLFFANLALGSVKLPPNEIFEILRGGGDELYRSIIFDIRLPRICCALLLGGALSVSGFCLQTFFSNPIAGPFVLGISSGAKFAVAVALVCAVGMEKRISSLLMVSAAFIGSISVMLFITLISSLVRRASSLIICGVMIGYICSAATDFIVTFASDSDIINLRGWSLGSFSGASWSDVRTICFIVGISMLFSIFLLKPMAAYRLGETYARSMGVNIKLFRIKLVLLSSVLSSCVTAFAGPVSFVGIAVPHLVRGFFRSSEPLIVVPACFLGGSAFCLFSDLLARLVFAPTELSISSVTSVLGAPIVIFIMLKRSNRKNIS